MGRAAPHSEIHRVWRELQARSRVGRGTRPRIGCSRGNFDAPPHQIGRMQAGTMRRINGAFENLGPITGNDRHPYLLVWRPAQRFDIQHSVARPHIGPYYAGPIVRRVGQVLDRSGHASGNRSELVSRTLPSTSIFHSS